jgi:hypothetical protein
MRSNIVTLEKFLERSKMIHKNFYDYSLVNYIDRLTPTTIICPYHGQFNQSPKIHMKGSGCSKCKSENCSKRRKNTKQKFVENSNIVHKNFYSYEHFDYVGSNIKSWITCPNHDEFSSSPNNHMRGWGCPKCKGNKTSKRQIKTSSQFLEECKIIHGSEFDYLSDYVRCNLKILIHHKICGKTFQQYPYSHKINGCPKCKESHGECKIRRLLEKLKISFIPEKRFDDCKDIKSLPFDFYLPEFNVCIEFDGVHHFGISIKQANMKEKDFNKIKIHDRIKNYYCDSNDTTLIRIPYWKMNEIEWIIRNELQV